MPSFLKKLITSKPTRNPYASHHHPSHTPSTTPPSPSHKSSPAPSTRSPQSARRPDSQVRPVSPSFLEEARRAVGRDPVTGRRVQNAAPETRGNTVVMAAGRGDAGNGQAGLREDFKVGKEEGKRDEGMARGFVREDIRVREMRRRDEQLARQLMQRELDGYFAP